MALNTWAPKSGYTAQRIDVTLAGTWAGETATISIGGIAIASEAGSVAATIATALISEFNASTHPYATGITASSGGSGVVTLTADVAGAPFVITLNAPGGSATLGQATIQANLSPTDGSVALNWSLGATPVVTNDVRIPYGVPKLIWGLEAFPTEVLGVLEVEDGAGPIGLPEETFQVTDTTVDSTVVEYRPTFWKIKYASARIGVADSLSSTPPAGISRCKIDAQTTAMHTYCYRSAVQTGARPPIEIKCVNTSSKLSNYGADVEISDGSTIDSVYNYTPGARTRVGKTVVVENVEALVGKAILYSLPTVELVRGGDVIIRADGTIPLVRGPGGTNFKLEGGVAITAIE